LLRSAKKPDAAGCYAGFEADRSDLWLASPSARRRWSVDGSRRAQKRVSSSGPTRSACVAATARRSSARMSAAAARAGNRRRTHRHLPNGLT